MQLLKTIFHHKLKYHILMKECFLAIPSVLNQEDNTDILI